MLLVAAVLTVLFEGGLVLASITEAACLGDCYDRPTSERVGGQAIFLAGLLLFWVGLIAVIGAVVVGLTGKDLRRRTS